MVAQHLFNRLQNIPAPTVIGAHGNSQAGIVFRLALRCLYHALQLGIKAAQIAHHFQAYAIGVHLADFTFQRRHEQTHQQ